MANRLAIHSVGASLAKYLSDAYPAALRVQHPCQFRLLSSGQMTTPDDDGAIVSLFLYRVTMNEHLRNVSRVNRPSASGVPLSLDLHYLMTVWADGALAEQTILAWAMHEIYRHPVLDQSSLSPEAQWGPGEVIQLIPAELTNEDIMRIWDAIEPTYRLSVSYIARMVRIEEIDDRVGNRVVAVRSQWESIKEPA
jgi:hypothetical protein